MKKLFAAPLLLMLAVSAASGADRTKKITMTVERALAMHDALQNRLDTYEKLVKDGASEKLVRVSYNFDFATRVNMAKNIIALKFVVDTYEKQRVATVNALSGGTGSIKIDAPEMSDFQAKIRETLEAEQTLNLFTLTESELRPKDNPIPASVLAAILPLMPAD